MAAVDRPPDESAAAGACVALGHDELRLVFAALLTTPNCEKDVGRCVDARYMARGGAARRGAAPRRRVRVRPRAFAESRRALDKLWERLPLTRRRAASPSRLHRCLCVSKEWSEVLANTPRCAASRGTRFRGVAELRRRVGAPYRAADASSPRPSSLWFKLFSMLDPTEALRAAAAAPAPVPGALAKRGSGAEKDFRDNDFQRRFIEQYCASACPLTGCFSTA